MLSKEQKSLLSKREYRQKSLLVRGHDCWQKSLVMRVQYWWESAFKKTIDRKVAVERPFQQKVSYWKDGVNRKVCYREDRINIKLCYWENSIDRKVCFQDSVDRSLLLRGYYQQKSWILRGYYQPREKFAIERILSTERKVCHQDDSINKKVCCWEFFKK